jgi:phosphoglycolate phosphatase
MKKIDTIIFDLDGTLLSTLEDIADGINYILKKYGYPQKTYDEIKSFVGNGSARLLEQSLPNGQKTSDFEKYLEEYKKYYLEHNNIKTSPYEGVMELLRGLSHKGYKLAIVSNKNDKNVKSLNKIYFEDYIETAIGESKDINRKPAADMIYKAIDELNSDLEKAVYIGDSEVDIFTAENANMQCISVTWGFRDKEFLKEHGAEYLIDEPHELLELLGEESVLKGASV